MKKYLVILFVMINHLVICQLHMDDYVHSSDSEIKENVPKGELKKFSLKSGYNNSFRDYYIYVPAQFKEGTETALLVWNDGHHFIGETGPYYGTTVLDNLIDSGSIPITIGVFVNPGHNSEVYPNRLWGSKYRSYEYDDMSDHYVHFLIDSLLPAIMQKYNVSSDPAMKVIGGLSSGGIAAFSAAWHRPDFFGKVMSHSGSFTNIRGGHDYPYLIRNSTKRDIKLFLQCGTNDLDNRAGNWYLSNLQMEAALKAKNYDYYWVSGNGRHNGVHGGTILPQTLVWMFADVVKGRNVPTRFEEEVDNISLENTNKINSKDNVIFTGSSSVRMWKNVNDDFPKHDIINTGFGGSHMSDLLHYTDELILKYNPKKVFIYEGDNDLNAGKSTKEILTTADKIIHRIHNNNPGANIYFISAKPSLSRWNLRFNYKSFNEALQKFTQSRDNVEYIDVWESMIEDNQLNTDLFISDGLHMTEKGYSIWKKQIYPFLGN